MTDLRISTNKLQIKMAEKCMNPYDLCSRAGISYTTYYKIMKNKGCKVVTLGKIAQALNCVVTEILED